MISVSVELVSIVSGSVVVIFWLAGLSFAAKRNTKDIEILWAKHDNLAEEIRASMSEVKSSLARIEGRLGDPKDR